MRTSASPSAAFSSQLKRDLYLYNKCTESGAIKRKKTRLLFSRLMPPLNNWCDLTAPLNCTNQSRSVESLENRATPSVWVSCVAHRTCCCLVRFSLGDKEAAWRLVHVRRLPVDVNTRGGGEGPPRDTADLPHSSRLSPLNYYLSAVKWCKLT